MAAVTAVGVFAWTVGVLTVPAAAAAPHVRFEHWLNLTGTWHTGAINLVNSNYVEGDVVPHRIVFENYEGAVTFAFSYEYEDSKIPAYGHDRLADVNATESSSLEGGLTVQGVFRFRGMTDVVIVGPTESNHGDRIDHAYVVTAQFTGEDAFFYYGAHLALDGDYPDHLGASSWHGGNLENRFDEDGPDGPRGDRTLSMKVGPGIPEEQPGRIVVRKSVPDDGEGEFEFRSSYGGDFLLANGQSNDSGPLPEGEYAVEELVSELGEGWSFHGLDCESSAGDPTSTWSVTGAEVDVTLTGGETVTCTFENRFAQVRQPGTITIIKTTGPSTGEAFGFQITPYESPEFSLSGQDEPSTTELENVRVFELMPGEYTVLEMVEDFPEGYRFHSVSCTGGEVTEDGAMVVIDLQAGDDYVCTFENRKTTPVTTATETGEIRIIKEAVGTERFGFEGSWSSVPFDLAHGEMHSSGPIVPGTYSVTENLSSAQLAEGWRFAQATCSDGSEIDAIEVSAGETVTCEFSNAQVADIVVTSTTTTSTTAASTTTTAAVAPVTAGTLPFTGSDAAGTGLIALFLMALGGLIVLAAAPVRDE